MTRFYKRYIKNMEQKKTKRKRMGKEVTGKYSP